MHYARPSNPLKQRQLGLSQLTDCKTARDMTAPKKRRGRATRRTLSTAESWCSFDDGASANVFSVARRTCRTSARRSSGGCSRWRSRGLQSNGRLAAGLSAGDRETRRPRTAICFDAVHMDHQSCRSPCKLAQSIRVPSNVEGEKTTMTVGESRQMGVCAGTTRLHPATTVA
jgi:hypothetical protein